jgi:hypothetical protein
MKKFTLPTIIIVLIVVSAGLNYFYSTKVSEEASSSEAMEIAEDSSAEEVGGEVIKDEASIPNQDFFNDIFVRREEARKNGDVATFNALISERGVESQMKARADSSDEDFSQRLKDGYQKTLNPDITRLPLVEVIPGPDETLLIYEGSVVIKEGDERIVTRVIRFVPEKGTWKIDFDHIDYQGIQPRKIPGSIDISITPNN